MHVAVVGATGVLARALIPQLLERGARVLALARSPDRVASGGYSGLEIAQLDLLHDEAQRQLRALLANCDAVVHAATAIPADPRAPGAWDANARLRTRGTKVVLAAAIAAGVRQYVQQSIVMAYAGHGDEWIDEDSPLDRSPARATICAPVIEMEAMVRAAPDMLRWSILRAGTFVGTGTFQDRTIAALHAGTELIVAGGSHFLPLVHVDDVAATFALALERAPAKAVLNVNDEPIRQRDYLTGLAAKIRASPPKESAATAPPSFRCSNARAAAVLGWWPARGIWPNG